MQFIATIRPQNKHNNERLQTYIHIYNDLYANGCINTWRQQLVRSAGQ